MDVRVTHSGHSLRYLAGMSSQMRSDALLRGHFEHERQKCQMFSPGRQRYSLDVMGLEAKTLCSKRPCPIGNQGSGNDYNYGGHEDD